MQGDYTYYCNPETLTRKEGASWETGDEQTESPLASNYQQTQLPLKQLHSLLSLGFCYQVRDRQVTTPLGSLWTLVGD